VTKDEILEAQRRLNKRMAEEKFTTYRDLGDVLGTGLGGGAGIAHNLTRGAKSPTTGLLKILGGAVAGQILGSQIGKRVKKYDE